MLMSLLFLFTWYVSRSHLEQRLFGGGFGFDGL